MKLQDTKESRSGFKVGNYIDIYSNILRWPHLERYKIKDCINKKLILEGSFFRSCAIKVLGDTIPIFYNALSGDVLIYDYDISHRRQD